MKIPMDIQLVNPQVRCYTPAPVGHAVLLQGTEDAAQRLKLCLALPGPAWLPWDPGGIPKSPRHHGFQYP